MKEFIDKLIERLEEEKAKGIYDIDNVINVKDAYGKAIKIVNELAEEYKVSEMPTGWIPCSERLPEDGVKVLCYGSNALGRMRYEVSCYSHKSYTEGEAELYRAKSVDGEYQEYKGDWK